MSRFPDCRAGVSRLSLLALLLGCGGDDVEWAGLATSEHDPDPQVPSILRDVAMVGDDLERIWKANDLCQSSNSIFAAAGVCDGYLPGVTIDGNKAVTTSELIDVETGTIQQRQRNHSL